MLPKFKDRIRNELAIRVERFASKRLEKDGICKREELKRDNTFIEYGREEHVEPTIDFSIGKLHPDFINAISPYKIEQPFVTALNHITLRTAFAIPTTERGEWVLDAMYNSHFELTRAMRASAFKQFKCGLRKRKKEHFQFATSLITHYSQNYYHWTIDCLPRLEGIRQYEKQHDQKVTIIVEHPLPEFKRKSLEILGFGDRVFLWEENMTAHCDTFILPSFINVSYYVSSYSCQWLNENLTKAVQPTEPSGSKLIYLSRASAPSRRLENEVEIVRCLEPFGVTCIFPETLTLAEQIALFQSAKVIISPSGAGLTNMAFSTNAYIVELFDYSYMTPWFMFQARACGHSYNLIVGETSYTDGIHQMIINEKDILAMMEKVMPKIA